jgi:hypothetical protein
VPDEREPLAELPGDREEGAESGHDDHDRPERLEAAASSHQPIES